MNKKETNGRNKKVRFLLFLSSTITRDCKMNGRRRRTWESGGC
jgi:hypothetical protein